MVLENLTTKRMFLGTHIYSLVKRADIYDLYVEWKIHKHLVLGRFNFRPCMRAVYAILIFSGLTEPQIQLLNNIQ